jgi:FMN phosphatase YigB (HAD superfamily)
MSTIKLIKEAKAKKLRIFDFDDTLAKVKANIIVKNNGKEKSITPAEFAVYDAKPGDTFNFKEFNAVIKTAVPIKSNITLLKKAASDPNTKTTILTARMLAYPVKHYLKKEFGLEIYIVALGDADPQKKSAYIEKEIKKGYEDIVFIDDSIKNVKAVESLKMKYPAVNLEVVHTTEAEHIKL